MTGITESFVLSGTKGMSVRVTVMESYDQLANTSEISVAVEVASSSYYGHIYYLNGAVAAAGQTLQSMQAAGGTHNVYVERQNTYYPIRSSSQSYSGSPWRLSKVAHNTDGSKTITVSINLTGEEANGRGADGWTVTGSREITLTHIPRASTVAATDAAIGAVSMVAVSRKSTGYTHCIAYRFGSLSGYLSPEGLSAGEVRFSQTSVAFPLPEAFYGQIPNAKSGTCTLTCRTYSGSTQIGDAQSSTFTVLTDAGTCAPLVDGVVKDVNAATLNLTGDANTLVRYVSNAECTLTATAKNQASITEKTIGAVAVSGNSRTISGIETGLVDFSATDSRGYRTSVTVEKKLIPYIHLSCNPDCKRTDPTSGNAKLSLSGNYFAGSFGKETNTLTLRYRINGGQWREMAPAVKNNGYTAEVLLTGLSYSLSHTVEVQASDKLQTVTRSVAVGKGIPVFDWGENDFAFHVPVYLHGGGIYNADGKQMFAPAAESADYPGCYYRTVNGNTEWINAPMIAGVEYRTTERWNGKPVYVKMVTHVTTADIGATSGIVNTEIAHGISGFGAIVRCFASKGVFPFPMLASNGGLATINEVNSSKIVIRTNNTTVAGGTFIFNLYYTKAG